MAMMIGRYAVEAVLKRINDAKIAKTTTTDATQYIRAYKYEKRADENGEYIAVNSLPFIHGSHNIETGIVNINVHVPQLESGGIPTQRLDVICDKVIALFPKDTIINGAYFNYFCDSRPTLDNDETYYVNLQIKVTYKDIQTE